MADEYRITFAIERQQPGDDDFTEIGFGSSGAWDSLEQAVHIVSSDIQNWQWETEGDMPSPESIRDREEAGRG